MREKLARFMAGRNGSDNLNRFISVLLVILLVVGVFAGDEAASLIWGLCLVGILYTYFRMLSKNLAKRQAENRKYLAVKNDFTGYFRGVKERWSQRKDYRFFRCPSCRTMLRVPRGKGKLKIVCRKCGSSFMKST